jgi:hypothetical protein
VGLGSARSKPGLGVKKVCREHRLAFTFLTGSDGPGLSVIAAVLFLFGGIGR